MVPQHPRRGHGHFYGRRGRWRCGLLLLDVPQHLGRRLPTRQFGDGSAPKGQLAPLLGLAPDFLRAPLLVRGRLHMPLFHRNGICGCVLTMSLEALAKILELTGQVALLRVGAEIAGRNELVVPRRQRAEGTSRADG